MEILLAVDFFKSLLGWSEDWNQTISWKLPVIDMLLGNEIVYTILLLLIQYNTFHESTLPLLTWFTVLKNKKLFYLGSRAAFSNFNFADEQYSYLCQFKFKVGILKSVLYATIWRSSKKQNFLS